MHLFGISDASLRLAVMLGVLATLLLVEALWPRRARSFPRHLRWRTHLALAVLGAGVVRVMAALSLPLVAVAAAEWARVQQFGLFNVIDTPLWLEALIAILLLDLAIWAQHLATHHLPLLWRLHRVHHADRDIDTSSALRFHPLEIAASMLFKTTLVLALGIAPVAVLIFEILLNGMAMFNHANVRLPIGLDRRLRPFVVTPDMHRVHHSVIVAEQQSNFGSGLSLWDHLFGTYTAQPASGHDAMTLGLDHHQTAAPTRLAWSLKLPLEPV